MKHEEISRKLSVYLENELSVEEKDEVKKHLGRCGFCREALTDLEWTVDQLRSLPEIDPPPWLSANIMTQLQEGPEGGAVSRPRSFSRRWTPLAFVAVSILFLCLIGYYLVRRGASLVSRTAPPTAPAASAPRPAGVSSEAGKLTGSKVVSPAVPSRTPPARPTGTAPQLVEDQGLLPLPPHAETSAPVQSHSAREASTPELPPTTGGLRMEGELGQPPSLEEKDAPRGVPQRKRGGADEALPTGE